MPLGCVGPNDRPCRLLPRNDESNKRGDWVRCSPINPPLLSQSPQGGCPHPRAHHMPSSSAGWGTTPALPAIPLLEHSLLWLGEGRLRTSQSISFVMTTEYTIEFTIVLQPCLQNAGPDIVRRPQISSKDSGPTLWERIQIPEQELSIGYLPCCPHPAAVHK